MRTPALLPPAAPSCQARASIALLNPAERIRAYRSGSLSPHQRALWAALYPDEVPQINGEFEWIALYAE